MIIYFVRIGLYVRYIYVGYKRFDISINIFLGGGGVGGLILVEL